MWVLLMVNGFYEICKFCLIMFLWGMLLVVVDVSIYYCLNSWKLLFSSIVY